MKYRIKKIEEILDISLADPETKFSLLLSFKILNYLGEEQIG
jgi:DNA-binding PucR family transcriptional regulator